MKLSVVIITKNEENDIEACLKSVSFADEIIVVDSESTDKTRELAKKKNAAVYIHSFIDFASQRNFALSKVHGEWVLFVDADERVSGELQKEITKAINENEYAAFKIRRKNYYFHIFEWPYIEEIERLFNRKKLIRWKGKVHESPQVEGNVGILSGYLIHHTHDDLDSMVTKTNEWSHIESILLFDSSHPRMVSWRFIRIMQTKFIDSYIRQGGWRAGTAGLIESIYQAYSYFIIYATLWEKQIKE